MKRILSQAQSGLIKNIRKLAEMKNAIILAHNYQTADIFEVADFIGDSLELSRQAMSTQADIIVFAGVHFMAESAKLLNPDKKVLLPDLDALCPMASMVDLWELEQLKKQYPNASVVCYINTTAETKAHSDICVTSANAVSVCASLPNKEIIFLPDEHLGSFVQSHLPDKKIITIKGFCHVHANAGKMKFDKAIEQFPKAKVLIHPETPKSFLHYADAVLGTGGMIKYIVNSKSSQFLIGTEQGMCARLSRDFPDKEFIPLLGICPNMKKITLQKIYDVLNEETNEIIIPSEIFERAKKPLTRMMKIGE